MRKHNLRSSLNLICISFDNDLNTHSQILDANPESAEKIDELISFYYLRKSIEQNTENLEFLTDDGCSSEELAYQILAAKIDRPRHVLLKLNILENELSDHIDCGEALDPRVLMMFAGLKADLINLIAQADE